MATIQDDEDYEAMSAFECLARAEEIKNNKKLLARARKYAKLKKLSVDAALLAIDGGEE